MVVIVGITGASGVIYGVRLLQALKEMGEVETHLIISKRGEEIIEHETEYKVGVVRRLADFWYHIDDVGARIASGSFQRDAMVILPCSMKTLSALANSYADNLIVRAADVTLKERKTLIVAPRETPLHLGHIENMLRLTKIGSIIFPPMPTFYSRPGSIQDIIDHTIGRVLDLLNLDHSLVHRWSGIDLSSAPLEPPNGSS